MASERLSAICDSVNQPTGKTGQLIDDVLAGSLLVGFHGFQPAFHSSLGAIHDYLPASASVCVENPAGVRLAWRKLESSLASDYDRRQAAGDTYYMPEMTWRFLEPGELLASSENKKEFLSLITQMDWPFE